ncbi:MAG: class A beta-lactamase-related serine hydrolase [Bacilli bacterium]|nr:class A beta-lactamase-related serine hydrolase [Bacilli bacterium]
MDTKDYEKRSKFLLVVSIVLFIIVCIFIVIVVCLGKRYNGEMEIVDRIDTEAKMYSGDKIVNDFFKNIAASQYTKCIQSSVDTKDLPSSVTDVVKELNEYYKKNSDYFAFKYVDIYTGFNVSYNEDQAIYGASTVKAPADIYIWELASKGETDLNEQLTYTSKFFNDGSGVLKNKQQGTSYPIRELLNYSIIYSDNIAHLMLVNRFKASNIHNFWQQKGTNVIYINPNSAWGKTSAHDAAIYMNELYRFYSSGEQYSEDVMDDFLNAQTKFITAPNDYKIANKPGWSGPVKHDAGIVFAENPYIIVILSNLGMNYEGPYFKDVSNLVYKLHTEYWKYKMKSCSSIIQYKQ